MVYVCCLWTDVNLEMLSISARKWWSTNNCNKKIQMVYSLASYANDLYAIHNLKLVKREPQTDVIPPTSLFFYNITLYITTILCNNEISFLFIVLYAVNLLSGILYILCITSRWSHWSKYVVKDTEFLKQ